MDNVLVHAMNKIFTRLVFFAFLFVWNSCKEKPVVPLKDMIDFEVENLEQLKAENKLKADGFTKVKLVAYLDKETAEENRTVKFESATGEFDVIGENKKEKSVYATLLDEKDAKLTAFTYLTLGTTPGNFTVSASIAAKSDYKDEELLTLSPAAPFEFKIEDLEKLRTENKLKADGLTKVKLVVFLDKETAEANRTVKFESRAGTFDVTGENKNEKSVYAALLDENDAKLTAFTYLTLGTTPGNFTVSASIVAKPDDAAKPEYKVEELLSLLPVAPLEFKIEDLEKLRTENKLKADGLTKIKLVAYLPKETANENRTVKFESPAGTFDVVGENKKEKSVYAALLNESDDKLTAFTYLTLGTTPGNFIVSASISTKPDFKLEEVITVRPLVITDIINISFDPPSGVRADDFSTIKVDVALSNTPGNSLEVSINRGTILLSENPKTQLLQMNQEGKAEFYIRVDNSVDPYLITAKIPNTTTALTKSVQLERAYPDNIAIEPSGLSVDTTGGSITLEAFLIRNVGKVSTGTPVTFKAYQAGEAGKETPVGRFKGLNTAFSDSTGKVAGVAFLADTGGINAAKPVFIKATTQKSDGTPLEVVTSVKIAPNPDI